MVDIDVHIPLMTEIINHGDIPVVQPVQRPVTLMCVHTDRRDGQDMLTHTQPQSSWSKGGRFRQS